MWDLRGGELGGFGKRLTQLRKGTERSQEPWQKGWVVVRKRKAAVYPAVCAQNLCWQKIGRVLERVVPQPASCHLKRELPLVNQPW